MLVKANYLTVAVLSFGTLVQPVWALDNGHVLWGLREDPRTTGAIGSSANPASSQTADLPKQGPLFTTPTDPRVNQAVDTSALAYYAQQHNQVRVDAEIRRLRALNPGWEPPADMSLLTGGPSDDQPLWDLFAAERFNELRTEIARRSTRAGGWQPPADLLAKLQIGETRQQLVQASEAQDWPHVIEIATRVPAIVDTADLDATWRVAAAYGRTGDNQRAVDLYQLILSTETRSPERISTVQKAAEVLDKGSLDVLFGMARKMPDGRSEFDSVRLDLLRARLAAPAGSKAATPPGDAELAALETSAAASRSADDASLLGWYRYRQEKWSDAGRWFQVILDTRPDAKAAIGQVLTLDHLGRPEEARRLAQDWQGRDDVIRDLFVSLVVVDLTAKTIAEVPPDRMSAFVTIVRTQQSGIGAQALAWYAFNSRQYDVAFAWFSKAMVWKPDPKTAEGHLRAALNLADKAIYRGLVKAYAETYPEAVHVVSSIPAVTSQRRSKERQDLPTSAYQAGNSAKCLSQLAAIGEKRSLSAEEQVLKGWCYLQASRPQEAAMAFASVRNEPGRIGGDASYGLSIALLRNGETQAAVEAASSLSAAKRTEVGTVALAQQAIASFDDAHYARTVSILDQRQAFAAPTRDLELLRAWATLKGGHAAEAMKLFQILDETLSTRETRSGLLEAGKLITGRLERK